MVETKTQTKPATTSETKAESKPAPKPEATKKPARKSSLKWVLLLVALAAAGFLGYQYWQKLQTALPDGIASGNGRLEAKLVDASAKEPLRVKEILVDEGSLVLNLVHVKNFELLLQAGATLLPANPSFYTGPQTVTAVVDTVVARVLDHLGIPQQLVPRWQEERG